jgi:NAD(P)-dependent dehydrogenase (short-subunit alcohol dehydrogenase family)
MTKIAVVTGANRGMGWGTSLALAKKGFEVALLGRDEEKISNRARQLEDEGGRAAAVALDLAESASIQRAAKLLRERYPSGIDLLVNNAGVFLESADKPYDPAIVAKTMQINALGPLEFSLALGESLRQRRGVVVNVSSGMGGLTEMNGGYPGYRLSKTALNAATRYLSQEWKSAGVRVNSVCPGWVRTDMGGAGAERSIEEGVASILWAALLPEDGPTGGFFRDGQPLAW